MATSTLGWGLIGASTIARQWIIPAADAREMRSVCRASGILLGTNHHLRNAVTHRTLRQLIEGGTNRRGETCVAPTVRPSALRSYASAPLTATFKTSLPPSL
jgi:hypothetical protein